jgi:type IV pilus assembly protein PilO
MKWYYQIAVVAGVCGALLAGVWYQFLSPMQNQITSKQSQLTTLNAEVAKALKQKLYFEKMKAESQELEAKLMDLKRVLPLEKETPEIVRSFYAEAQGSGVRILRLTLRGTVEHEVYTEWPWDMEVIGTYNSVAAFLDRIRQLPRIVNVAGMKLVLRNSAGEKAATESVGATYTATTFIYHEEPASTPAPAPAAAN